MAFIRTHDENKDLLRGPIPTGGGGSLGSFGSKLSLPRLDAPRAPESSPAPGSLTAAGSELSALTGQLGSLGSSFREEAGPAPEPFGEADRGLLSRAVTTGDLAPARKILQTTYEGPAGLDPETVADIRNKAQQLQAFSGQLARGRGLAAYYQGVSPGLTLGQARFEAERVGRPLQKHAVMVENQARRLQAQLSGEEETARQIAEARAEGARARREEAQSFLRERGEGISEGLEQRVSERAAHEKALQEAYKHFQETGDLGALEGFGDLSGFDTELQRQLVGAKAARADIDARYADISHVPLMSIAISGRGNEHRMVRIGGRDYMAMRAKQGRPQNQYGKRIALPEGMSQAEFQRLAQRAWDRQRELEQNFAPATAELIGRPDPREVYYTPGNVAGYGFQRQPGRYSEVSPLYYGEGALVPDVRAYLDYQPGTAATRSNVATADELAELNRIGQLLGLEPIQASQYQAGGLVPHLEDYLATEGLARDEVAQRLGEATSRQVQAVSGARKRFKEAKRKKLRGQLLLGAAPFTFGATLLPATLNEMDAFAR